MGTSRQTLSSFLTSTPTLSGQIMWSCILLGLLTTVAARPKDERSLVPAQQQQLTGDSWFDSRSGTDSWRAFQPVSNVSTSRWWEQNLDDHLWDSSKYEDITEKKEFCKVDMECRAGRECVGGVCKCALADSCAGHIKPICGSDGVQYSSHCELHRTACIMRKHIRVDRRGRCFKEVLEAKERSWLLEQEKMADEMIKQGQEKKEIVQEHKQEIVQEHKKETYPFPEDLTNAPIDQNMSDVKKAVQADQAPAMTDLNVTKSKKKCTWEQMGQFKEALLMYHCQKFVEPKCDLEVHTDRNYLSMLMFSSYDQDFDFSLTADELDDRERDEHFASNIIVNCHLHDFIKYADTDEADEKLTVTEFTNAFELSEVSTPTAKSQQSLVIDTLATAGNGLELKCGLDADRVVWKHHGMKLEDDKHSHQLMVFDDGALFFSKVGLHHIGNYTCYDVNHESNNQVHKLRVQTVPVVHVTPVTQSHMTGADIELRCHTEGVPKPEITWKQGDTKIHNDGHFSVYYGYEHIVLHNAKRENDEGIYTCSAHNQAGTTDKSVSVSIISPTEHTAKASAYDMGTFVVFHPKGITVYDPMLCLKKHNILANFGYFKFIPDNLVGPLRLCVIGRECQWGASVTVGGSFIYVTQPDQNRVLMMDAETTWNPLQVIDTDSHPGKLWYVSHLDQLWVLCSNNKGRGEGGKIIMVIRDASQHIQHRAVHTRPVGNHFDLVEDVFIAPPNDFDHTYNYGYVTHSGQSTLRKLNLEEMSYTKVIDLSNYGCVPQALAFVPIGGHVILECVSASDQHSLQLVMDYLTDAIVSTVSLAGRPLTSPDSRHLVTVDEFTGRVVVNSVSDEGTLFHTYELTVSASISDTAFMPSSAYHGYDLLFSSADDDYIITMNLVTGKVDKLPGAQNSDTVQPWHPSPARRHIVSGTPMSNYFIVPSKSALVIVNARFRVVDCEFLDSQGSDVMLYIPSKKTS